MKHKREFKTIDEHRALIREFAPSLSDQWVDDIVGRNMLEDIDMGGDQFVRSLNNQSDETVKRRLQAITIFPVLIDAFGDMRTGVYDFGADVESHQRCLVKLIDEGRPLKDAVLKYLHLLSFKNFEMPHLERIMKLPHSFSNTVMLRHLDDFAESEDLKAFPVSEAECNIIFQIKMATLCAYDISTKWYKHQENARKHMDQTLCRKDYETLLRLGEESPL